MTNKTTYKIVDFQPEFQTVLTDLGVKPNGTKLTAQNFAEAGLNPELLDAIQDYDTRDQTLDGTEQTRFVRFYNAVTADFEAGARVQEFKRLTSIETSPWINHPAISQALAGGQYVPSQLYTDVLRACLNDNQGGGHEYSAMMLGSGAGIQDMPLELRNLLGALTNPVDYSYCPADPQRLDLSQNQVGSVALLPAALLPVADTVMMAFVVTPGGETGIGSLTYLGNGYFATARHVFYPENGSDPILGLAIEPGYAFSAQTAATLPMSAIKIVAEDPERDLILFQIPQADSSEVPAQKLPSSTQDPQSWVGQTVIHIGAPQMEYAQQRPNAPLEKLFSVGRVVSVDPTTGQIVTDCPAAGGSSGGLLMLTDGTVIGVASQAGFSFNTAEESDGRSVTVIGPHSQIAVFSIVPADWVTKAQKTTP